jgi:hypothetical protein
MNNYLSYYLFFYYQFVLLVLVILTVTERVLVKLVVPELDTDIVFVNGLVVGIPVLDRVRVTDGV